MSLFTSADILLPKDVSWEKWAVIACDQFTSQPEYWESVRREVGDAPSTLGMILPEAELGGDIPARVEAIREQMRASRQFLTSYPDAFVYVERTMKNGNIRRGLVGRVDLEAYDYSPDSQSGVRPTERTVPERIPPRKRIRENAELELPHVILFCDDPERTVIEPLTARKKHLPMLYDFDLMMQGGHVTGWLVAAEDRESVQQALDAYEARAAAAAGERAPMAYAVGDGNHSLATAKACYEDLKQRGRATEAARYALVELENVEDDAQTFEPIHRIVHVKDKPAFLTALRRELCDAQGTEITVLTDEGSESVCLRSEPDSLPVGVLQTWLDDRLAAFGGSIDYIHGEDALAKLCREENTVGFLLPPMDKAALFPYVMHHGTLPRKTFSIGHAEEKRYYLEARDIR